MFSSYRARSGPAGRQPINAEKGPGETEAQTGHTSLKEHSLTEPTWFNRSLSILACLCWMAVSSGLILLNKHLMTDLNFKYPMTLAGSGMAFSAIASFFACRVFRLVDEKSIDMDGNNIITPKFYITRIMPVGFFMAGTLYSGNMVYLYLTVSFIQILKSFTPVLTMVCMFAFRLETPTRELIGSVLLIAFGTAAASYGEVNFSIVGLSLMFVSESLEAIRVVLTQVILTGLKFHPIEGLMYFAPACVFWSVIGALACEYKAMLNDGAILIVAQYPLKFFCAAAMGFFVNFLSYCVIVLTSSLTLKVLGTVKNALLVWAGILFLQELVTPLQGGGYLVSLIGFSLYNWIKMRPDK